MVRRLQQQGVGDDNRPTIDGEPVGGVLSIRHVFNGGGVYLDGVAQYDLDVLDTAGNVMFSIPPEGHEGDEWYSKLAEGSLGFVDWSDRQAVESDPRLSQEAVLRHPGRTHVVWLSSLSRSLELLKRNVAEFVQHVRRASEPPLILQLHDPALHDAFLSEAERLLHNALAAARSNVDRTRVLVDSDWSPSSQWRDERQAVWVERFKAIGQVQFIHGLRNYMLHKSLPVAMSRFNITAGSGMTHRYVLQQRSLLAWDGWSSVARRWLDEQTEDVDLAAVWANYMATTAAYEEFLRIEFAHQKRDEISSFEREQERHFSAFPYPS